MELDGANATPLLSSGKQHASTASLNSATEQRSSLHGGLLCTGVWVRLLTLLNAVALLAAVGYGAYVRSTLSTVQDTKLPLEARAAEAYKVGVALLAGFALLRLELATWFDEKGARNSLGLAFGPGGRLFVFLSVALLCAPLVPFDATLASTHFLVVGGAVAATAVDGLLQAWILSCSPLYRTQCVVELQPSGLVVDDSKFPQVYQRDEGAHLHLGVLLPGFASRERCMMTANCDSLRIVGEISNLEGPYEAVDGGNTVSGPFGPFERDVKLASPIDISTPVESRMGHGIFEFRFLKGYVPVAEP